jgi:acetylornithine deacetylase/succinyl-diaminopimelate desuccinylase-like protein
MGTSEQSYTAEAEALEICRDLIRLDTSNYGDGKGPGERKAAEHVAALLAEVGIESEIVEAAPGRASVVARWGDQTSSRDGLLVHGHLDVVPAQAADWTVDPFAGEVADGYLWGRGAVDMKDFDAMLLSVVRARQRAGAVPERPVTLVFTSDEEAGGREGAHWLVEHRPDLFEGCTEAIGEVGGFSLEVGGQRLYLIESGEKGISWMRLRARGTAGHGSMRQSDNAITHLAQALLLAKIAELTGDDAQDPDALLEHVGPAIRMLGAGLRNSTNATMLEAGYKHNVVPGEAVAYVDGRYLPGHTDSFLPAVQEIVGDRVDVEPYIVDRALEYPFRGDLVDAMTVALHAEDPDAHVAPYLMSGGTDAKAWDKLGITSYGFTPLRLPGDLDFTALFHGVDERVPVDALEFGARVFDRFLDLA